MTTKDLMIGDWVFINHCSNRLEPCYGQVTGIDKNGEDVYTTDGMVDISLIEPIPLTEEILKANGFEEHVGEKGAYGVTTAPYFKRDDSPEVFCDGHPFAVWFDEPVDIKYVHQLQHVLRLYGAEKEIKIKED